MVDGQRQSYYGPTRADALAGRERAANHDHRQAAARDGATVADFAAEWLAAARRANGVGFLKMQPAGPPACAAGEAPSAWSVATVPLSSAGRM